MENLKKIINTEPRDKIYNHVREDIVGYDVVMKVWNNIPRLELMLSIGYKIGDMQHQRLIMLNTL